MRVDRKSWAPSKMTRLTRLECPESVATVTNLAPVLPLMTETDAQLIFNSLISDAVYSLRTAFLFTAFLATSISNLIRSG